jgi:hypothetical protein
MPVFRTGVGLVAPFAALAAFAAACSSGDSPGENVGHVGQSWTQGTPACGTAIGSWGIVTAYSNGSCFGNINCTNCDGQGFTVHTSSNGAKAYGGAWQCVELVTRYFDATYGIWLSNNAGTPLCNSAVSTSGLTVYGGGYNNNSPPEPVAGDALVWNYGGGGGHTALVTGSNGSTISYLEQNWGNTTGYAGTGTTPWSGSNFGAPSDSLGGYSPVCWIHVKANGAATCPYGNGLYCGGNGVKGDSSTLYQCTNGSVTVVEACGLGCQHEPQGQNDQCAPCPKGDGLYCGGDGVPGSASTLYACKGGAVSVSSVCSYGCQAEPSGQNDKCLDAASPDAGVATDSGPNRDAAAAADTGVTNGSDSDASWPDTAASGGSGGCAMTSDRAASAEGVPLLVGLAVGAALRRRPRAISHRRRPA